MRLTWKAMKTLAFVGVTGTVLAACSGDNDSYSPPPPPPPPPPAANFEDQFGNKFATAFRNDANDEPEEVAAGDINAVDKTIDPDDVPDPA